MKFVQHGIKITVISFFIIFQLTSCGKVENEKFKKGVEDMKVTTKQFITKELELGLINWACNYDNRPVKGSSELNIQFDHIPPNRFYKAMAGSAEYKPKQEEMEEQDEQEEMEEEQQQQQQQQKEDVDYTTAPTVAVSDFDHHGDIWNKCTTGQSKFAKIFRFLANMDWDNNERFKCAIFVSLACMKDVAAKKGADVFDRYKDGFQQLVVLHGTKNIKPADEAELHDWIKDKISHTTLRKKCCILEEEDKCHDIINT